MTYINSFLAREAISTIISRCSLNKEDQFLIGIYFERLPTYLITLSSSITLGTLWALYKSQ